MRLAQGRITTDNESGMLSAGVEFRASARRVSRELATVGWESRKQVRIFVITHFRKRRKNQEIIHIAHYRGGVSSQMPCTCLRNSPRKCGNRAAIDTIIIAWVLKMRNSLRCAYAIFSILSAMRSTECLLNITRFAQCPVPSHHTPPLIPLCAIFSLQYFRLLLQNFNPRVCALSSLISRDTANSCECCC